MEMVSQVSAEIVKIGAAFGAYLVPLFILCSIALVAFAKNSYKLFKIVLPIAGVITGSILGALFIGPYLAEIPEIKEVVNAYFLSGIVTAAILAFFCFKFHKFTVLLIGAATGYLLVGRIVKDLLLSIEFIFILSETTERPITLVVGIIIGLICLVVTTLVVKKFFRPLYVIVTSIGCSALGFGLAAVFTFATTSFADYATVTALGLGAIVGLIFCAQQLSELSYE